MSPLEPETGAKRHTVPPTPRRAPALAAAPLVVLGLLVATTAPGHAQGARSDREREMWVSVLDRTGKPATGLGPADFVVREDGIVREVLRVQPAIEPIDIALVVDNSLVMTPALADLRRGLRAFVEAIQARDSLALVTVADRPTLAQGYTLDRETILKAIDRLFVQPESGSCLVDAIAEASRGLEKRSARRAAIIAVSGEGREFSNTHYELVLDALARSHAALHALTLGGSGEETMDDGSRYRGLLLDLGPRASGGRRSVLLTSMGLADELQSIAAELNGQYHVVYARPDTLIPPGRIEVSARRPDLTARGTPVLRKAGE